MRRKGALLIVPLLATSLAFDVFVEGLSPAAPRLPVASERAFIPCSQTGDEHGLSLKKLP